MTKKIYITALAHCGKKLIFEQKKVYCFSNNFLRRNTYCQQKLKHWSKWIDILLPCLISKTVMLLVLTCLCFKILDAQVCVLKTDSTMWFRINTSDYERHSVQFSRSVMSDSLQPHELQHSRPPYQSPTPGVYPNPCPLSRWTQPSRPLSSLSPPALNFSQHQSLFQWVNSSHEVARVLEFQL